MSHDLVLFDGTCPLCRRSVLFALSRDPDGSRFRFAPLTGTTARRRLGEEALARLPDSVVVLTADGALLTRSDAALRILVRSGRTGALLGSLLAAVPRRLRDALYDAVARRRRTLWRRFRPDRPLPPPQLTDRFLP